MPRSGKIGHRKGGGRTRGVPNKRSLELRKALEAQGCDLAEYIVAFLRDPEVSGPEKIDLVTRLLPYHYPQLRPIDPEGYLTHEQMAGALGAQATKFRAALERYMPDQTLIALVLDELRPHATNANGASAPAV